MMLYFTCLAEELRESLDAVDVVGCAARFPATVHGQDGISHVNSSQRNRRGKDVSEGAASGYVRVINETLTRHTSLPANLREDSCRHSIAGILLGCIELDDQPTA